MSIKSILRSIVPAQVKELRWKSIKAAREAGIASLPLAGKFNEIYRRGYWGSNADGSLSSGNGTRDQAIVGPYVASVGNYLKTVPAGVTVVDVGCGDFEVGRQIRPFTAKYIACDISTAIIEQDRSRFTDPDLEFLVLNAVEDEIPPGDVLTIRQVLQHLSNADIARIVPKLSAFKAVIITEGVPAGSFEANIDHRAGFSVRPIESHSGVDLALPPFNLRYKACRVLCEPENTGSVGRIRTTLYEMS
ncbi:class I SAM-dependent methyltransferase [Devosia sp.]|uniref:class I SAM-dependent methyltransferase n=1 Tax=Devosia sp. TaxID=1871048 RepID=UPI0032652141